ncbi:MAG: GNAT family N-acetyltransferase, partial [Clostridia bacterium]|nr:GNAT family N-acetyltransferase [Clostridia bacterium]
SRMMETVLADLKASGFRRVTIGVGPEEEQNVRLYRRMGFTEKVKDCYVDPCAMDENMRPEKDECYWLLAKEL